MTVKELRQSMRRANFIYPFLGIQLLAVAAMAMEFAASSVYRSDAPGIMNLQMIWESGPFWRVAFLVCGVIMPLGGINLMKQELEDGNHELLLIASLNRWSVVRGKFFVLWSVNVLVLVSLLPYVVVRYFIGGVEMWQEFVCTLTVVGTSAIVSAGSLGAAGYKTIAGRILVLTSYLLTFFASGMIILGSSAAVSSRNQLKFSVFFNANALGFILCYTIMGLTICRSRLILEVRAYEIKPSRVLIGLLFFAPFLSGIAAAVSCGNLGIIGLIIVVVACVRSDVTLKTKMPTNPSGLNFSKLRSIPPVGFSSDRKVTPRQTAEEQADQT